MPPMTYSFHPYSYRSKNSEIELITLSCCSLDSSGNIGNARTSTLAASEFGIDPGL
jgi:hypothetical protein